MKNNLLITGPNSCGKSQYAENLLTLTNKKLCYFATLPATAEYLDKISKHKDRRNKVWKVLESSLDIREDLNQIKKNFETGHLMLFDGMTIYIKRLLIIEKAKPLVKTMIDSLINILTNQINSWIIVDIGWQYIKEKYQPVLLEWSRFFQSQIVRKCNVKHLIHKGTGFYEYKNIMD